MGYKGEDFGAIPFQGVPITPVLCPKTGSPACHCVHQPPASPCLFNLHVYGLRLELRTLKDTLEKPNDNILNDYPLFKSSNPSR